MKYEINDDTLAIIPYVDGNTRIIEKNDEYFVNETPYEVMEHSCKYFGSSIEGRISGAKDILGTIYKTPVIVEESQKLIFFPTQAVQAHGTGWISYNNIKGVEKQSRKSKIIFNNGNDILVDCPYFSVKNQIFRCTMLDAVSESRKKDKKNG